MKKALAFIVFLLICLALVGVVLAKEARKSSLKNEVVENCQTAMDESFEAQIAHGLIIKNRTLLAVRLEGEKNFSPPGGHIEKNESPEDGLKRELAEELKIGVSEKDFRVHKTYCEVGDNLTVRRTYTFFIDDWDGNFSPETADRIKWVKSDYVINKNADTELVKTLEILKSENLID